MSYKTNPIANRLRIIKGWKNSLFLTKRLDHIQQIVMWLKLYLFLKGYLALRNIQLLFCEIRYSEKDVPLLYLSINKIKKNKKKKHISSLLKSKNLKSPLMLKVARKNKFLLYSRSLSWLKKTFVLKNTDYK